MHPAEQIMQAVEAALTGLATTQERVYRGKTFPVPEEDDNALLIYQGADTPEEDEYSAQLVDSELEFFVIGYVATKSEQAETELNQIRLEVHKALAPTNPPLGLPFMQTIDPLGATAPSGEGDSKRVIAGMQLGWICTYRADHFDPEITGG